MPYDVVERKDGGIEFKVQDKRMHPLKFQRVYFKKLKPMLRRIWAKLLQKL